MNVTDEPSDSLLSALTKAKITSENHPFIRRLTDAVGISGYRAVERSDKPYVIATRRDGLRDLHIYWGYTTGFTTKEEAVRVAGGVGTVGSSSSPKGTWYVTHPVNKVYSGAERSRTVRREAGLCPSCRQQLPVTGVCDNCE
ncbi:hypothetical protein C0J29_30510 (plasmid) [Mycobacterium paragordonae]|nr:hypothetical protein C0J29_30510 [Mycobacterium paragordonae]PJE25167.1 MAG: hypothetical protein CK431_02140 [Mycobacterium sp.]